MILPVRRTSYSRCKWTWICSRTTRVMFLESRNYGCSHAIGCSQVSKFRN